MLVGMSVALKNTVYLLAINGGCHFFRLSSLNGLSCNHIFAQFKNLKADVDYFAAADRDEGVSVD